MDNGTFDNVSRLIGSGATRRRVVGALVAAVVGGSAIAGVESASAVQRATCRPLTNGCTRSSQCCSGSCERRTTVPRRKRHRCGCAIGMEQCGDSCHDLQTDYDHCSACFESCPPTTDTCVSGVCTCGGSEACADGEICCGGACLDGQSDKDNCGACGNVCDGGYCDAGTCVLLPCGDQSIYPDGWVQGCLGLVNGEAIMFCGSGDQTAYTCQSSADCDAFRDEKAGELTPGVTSIECVSVWSWYDASQAEIYGPSLTEGYCLVYAVAGADGTCGGGGGGD